VLIKVLIRRAMSTLEKSAISLKVLMGSQGAHLDLSTLEEIERTVTESPGTRGPRYSSQGHMRAEIPGK
jgi:hypothetical protein